MFKELETALTGATKEWKQAKRQVDRQDRVRQSDLDRMRQQKPKALSIKDAA